MRTMFSFKYFLVIIFFCHFVTCSKFLVLTKNGWKSVKKFTGEQKTYLLKSTENPNEFIGIRLGIKLYLQNQSWVIELGEENYHYPAQESVSLPIGRNRWSSSRVSTMIEIKELQCGKNQGYMIGEERTHFPSLKLDVVASRTAIATTAENCFAQNETSTFFASFHNGKCILKDSEDEFDIEIEAEERIQSRKV